MSKLISQIKFGVFLGLCAFGLLILAGYIKPTRPGTKNLFYFKTYKSIDDFQTDFNRKIAEGYEVQAMSQAATAYSVDPRHYWTVIYVKRQ